MKLKKYKRNIISLQDIEYTVSNLKDIERNTNEQEVKYKINNEIKRQEEKLHVLKEEILKTERNIENILIEYSILKEIYESEGWTRKQLVKYLIARGIKEEDILTPEIELYGGGEKYDIIEEKPEEPEKEEYHIRIRIIKDAYYIILYRGNFEKNNYRISIKQSYMDLQSTEDNYKYDYVITEYLKYNKK